MTTLIHGDIAFTMWVTASRWADLASAHITHRWTTGDTVILRVSFPQFKSDLFGTRMVTKTIEVPNNMEHRIVQALRNHASVKYSQMLETMHSQYLTCHSVRRGAVTYLAQQGVPAEQVIVLTGHARPNENIAIRRYTEATPLATEAMIQRRLTRILVTALLG